MIIGLNLLYLLPGIVGGTETYAAGLFMACPGATLRPEFVVFVNMESAGWPLPDDPTFPAGRVSGPRDLPVARYRYEQLRLPGRARAAASNCSIRWDMWRRSAWTAPAS